METTASHFPGYFTKDSGNDALTGVAADASVDNAYRIAKAEADIKEALGNGFCSVEKSIGDAECDILTKVGDAECSILKSQADISHRSTIHLNSVERDLQNRVLENRQILTKEIGDKHDRLKDQLFGFERFTADRFCKIEMEAKENTRLILDRLNSDKLDEKNEIIESLRHERSHDRFAHQFGLQNQEISSLKQMLNSVEYNQKFVNRTTQFGTGNLAGTAQTANQG